MLARRAKCYAALKRWDDVRADYDRAIKLRNDSLKQQWQAERAKLPAR